MPDASKRSTHRGIWRGLFGVFAFCSVTGGLVALAIAALGPPPSTATSLSRATTTEVDAPGDNATSGAVRLEGGTFSMGKRHACCPDESPAHDVTLTEFRIDAHEVTNAQFAAFVAATGYITEAEQQGWGLVFGATVGNNTTIGGNADAGNWQRTAGADWRHPRGPSSTVVGRGQHPAVQVSWHDATAYADWAGGRLPTEAEWEYAARAGLGDADFPWGAAEQADGMYHANYHQGWFPETDAARDGHAGLAAIGRHAAAGNGTVDMSGNAAEWCADWYAEDYYARSPQRDPGGPSATAGHNMTSRRTMRGGSWLSPEGYCPAYRVTARDSAPPETRRDDLGFRCVYGVE